MWNWWSLGVNISARSFRETVRFARLSFMMNHGPGGMVGGMKRGGYSISRGKRGYVTNTATSLNVRDLDHTYKCYKSQLLIVSS
jgi:hypothetical protein